MKSEAVADAANGKSPFSCKQFGDEYKPIKKLRRCYKINGQIRAGVLINDPDDHNTKETLFQPLTRVQTDVKTIRKSALGVLSSFIRFQAELNPGLMNDKIYHGLVREPFAVGIDAIEIALEKSWGSLKAGKIQNAVNHAMPRGFTNRGAESLNGRAATGAAVYLTKKQWNLAFSITDPTATTSREATIPNLGIGLNVTKKPWVFGVGAALLNVDKILPLATNIPTAILVANGAPLHLHSSSRRGWAVGGNVQYKAEKYAAYLGLAYTKAASNDAIFAFSDGFDALSLFSGLSYKVGKTVDLGFDFSFISAVGQGMDDKRGIEAAFRVAWRPLPNWTVASEVGYDTVPNFGAGDGFFYSITNKGKVDFRLTIDREF